MNEINFCYWLQGFFELSESKKLSKEQVDIIKEHLALVFKKQTFITLGGEQYIRDLIDEKSTPSISEISADNIKDHETSFSC